MRAWNSQRADDRRPASAQQHRHGHVHNKVAEGTADLKLLSGLPFQIGLIKEVDN